MNAGGIFCFGGNLISSHTDFPHFQKETCFSFMRSSDADSYRDELSDGFADNRA